MFFINIFPSILFIYFCWGWRLGVTFYIYFFNESLSLIFFFCFLGLLVRKLPLFFFHFWLTKAHVRASGCGSMILARLILKIGSLGLYKFYFIFLDIFKFLSRGFSGLVVLTRLVLLGVMIRFFDLKFLVACSSIIHIAPIFPSVLRGGSRFIYSSVLIIVGHGVISYYIFYLIRVIYELSYNRSVDFNKSLHSFSKTLIFFFFFFFLMNLGFPPFLSFIRELIFFFFFLNFSNFSGVLFGLRLIMSGLVFFFSISKGLFGKKYLFNIFFVHRRNVFYSKIFLFFLLFLPYIYFYFFSLIKISSCGGEELKSIDI